MLLVPVPQRIRGTCVTHCCPAGNKRGALLLAWITGRTQHTVYKVHQYEACGQRTDVLLRCRHGLAACHVCYGVELWVDGGSTCGCIPSLVGLRGEAAALTAVVRTGCIRAGVSPAYGGRLQLRYCNT